MKKLMLSLASISLAVGCATQKTILKEEFPDGSNKSTTIVTRTFWDSKSELAKLKTSHTKTSQIVGITDLGQETTSTNINTLVESVVGAAIKAAIKP